MEIIVDTREVNPLEFKVAGSVTAVSTETMPIGDYAVRYKDGASPPVCFERKAMGDLYKTMTEEYDRFKRELAKAWDSRVTVILIIEGTMTKVGEGYSYRKDGQVKESKFKGESMVQKLMTLTIRYKLPVVFCSSRAEMSRYIVEYFEAIGREMVARSRISHDSRREGG